MKLNVFVQGQRVAVLESADGFQHALTYLPGTSPEDFVSLLMPVRTASWNWPRLHPFFEINLPEGFLLSVLRETLGPHLGAQPLELLAVVGHNTIGRVQLALGETLNAPASVINLQQLLHGENSEAVFLALMHEHAASGVSGVVPKFLTPQTQALFRKASVATERYIVKGSSSRFPFVALNEHLCMEVARKTGFPAPATLVSDDGQTLLVERFDIDPTTGQRLGFEDCCSLLGLSPEDKYQSTWERVARLAREWVPPVGLREAHEHLAATLLLTYALGNADCHTKNLALTYTSVDDVRLAPIYDMVSILIYDNYCDNPPGLFVAGTKKWTPGKALWTMLQQHFGIDPAQSRRLVDRVCTAVTEVVPTLIQCTRDVAGFQEYGARMLREWNRGLQRLRERSSVALPDIEVQATAEAINPPLGPERHASERVGESPLLGKRGRRGARPAS